MTNDRLENYIFMLYMLLFRNVYFMLFTFAEHGNGNSLRFKVILSQFSMLEVGTNYLYHNTIRRLDKVPFGGSVSSRNFARL
jgi:hypothetical protein